MKILNNNTIIVGMEIHLLAKLPNVCQPHVRFHFYVM
ncbi:hypothetical protein SPAB_03296 [Salmonella enterica subsp. enterica serovar Paratyphi B str. SPB7]|uniref:Uncharacterized protein n=1 Tax=Salmonella paratyphi B (strain ATCC BAA-1250 / SPB7) TaxID=1016998 RepID=A0A6C6Z5E5_SALPB|nr:hypothetical protein SPAB_03296 [Salmonella enterica subsp. enterica serovar Paratyphi B str. SPB7]